jgi:hypothetical protein
MAPRSAFTAARACVPEGVRHVGYLLWERLGDVEAVATDIEEGAIVTKAVLKVVEVVVDAVNAAEPPDKARGDLLAESRWGSWPELHSGRYRTLPHGGHQLSWYFDDSSHRDGLSTGLVGVQRRVRLGIGQWQHITYPGSGPSSPEVKPLRPALVFITSTWWLQRSLSCLV